MAGKLGEFAIFAIIFQLGNSFILSGGSKLHPYLKTNTTFLNVQYPHRSGRRRANATMIVQHD